MSTPKIGVIRFPGSNCEQDAYLPLKHQFGIETTYLWHRDADLQGVDAIIIPGGFSYGDYLRAGALASMSPILKSVIEFANQGRPVVGICNGFQILTEANLLPGALRSNRQCRFLCDNVTMTVNTNNTPFTTQYTSGEIITLPIAHAEGNYIASEDTLKSLQDNEQIVFTYTQDVNGSLKNIAGICSPKRNVLGMMPHPERALQTSAISTMDGKLLFNSLLGHIGYAPTEVMAGI